MENLLTGTRNSHGSILKVVMEVNMEERIDHPSRGTWLWSSHYRSLLYCVILQTRRYSTKEISNKGASDCLKCTHVYFPTILNEKLWPEKPGLPPFILEGAGKDCLRLEEQRSGEEGATKIWRNYTARTSPCHPTSSTRSHTLSNRSPCILCSILAIVKQKITLDMKTSFHWWVLNKR